MKSSEKVNSAASISILIFDTTAITSDLLKHAFSKESGYKVVGCARNIQEAVPMALEQRPDVVIISASAHSDSSTALQLLQDLLDSGSDTRSIVLSAHLTNEGSVAYFRAQARGVLLGASTDFATLCKCVTCVHAGQIWANSEQLSELVKSLAQAKSLKIVNSKGLPILSAREEEVLQLLSEGLSNRDLANELRLSEHTVKNHLFRIFDKLGVSSRMEAVLYSLNHMEKGVPGMAVGAREMSPKHGNGTAMAVNE